MEATALRGRVDPAAWESLWNAHTAATARLRGPFNHDHDGWTTAPAISPEQPGLPLTIPDDVLDTQPVSDLSVDGQWVYLATLCWALAQGHPEIDAETVEAWNLRAPRACEELVRVGLWRGRGDQPGFRVQPPR
jgi:hypothetical protein